MLVWNRPALLFISLRLAAGAMGHGPEMFQTFNQQHNPSQKFGKIAKTYGALRQGLRWAPMGPDGPRWASRLKRLLLILEVQSRFLDQPQKMNGSALSQSEQMGPPNYREQRTGVYDGLTHEERERKTAPKRGRPQPKTPPHTKPRSWKTVMPTFLAPGSRTRHSHKAAGRTSRP